MKALVDENLSPALARSLNALFAGEHEIVHIREKFGPGVKDVAWIGQLSTEGALDRHLWRSTHYPEQGRICCISKLSASRVFSFEGLYKAPVVKQMERLLALWCTIEKQSEIVAGGAMFELPIKSTRIEQLKV
ncbi:hypothetical protein NKI53_05080 [Mesorhizobium sp. M0586]